MSGLGRKDFEPLDGNLGCAVSVRARVRDKPGFEPNSDGRAAAYHRLRLCAWRIRIESHRGSVTEKLDATVS